VRRALNSATGAERQRWGFSLGADEAGIPSAKVTRSNRAGCAKRGVPRVWRGGGRLVPSKQHNRNRGPDGNFAKGAAIPGSVCAVEATDLDIAQESYMAVPEWQRCVFRCLLLSARSAACRLLASLLRPPRQGELCMRMGL